MNPDEQDDPLEALKRLKAQQAPDPLEQLKAMKAPQGHDYHAEFKSGALGKRMARENANDTEQAAAADSETQPGIAGSIADATQGIPGAGALQAGVRSLVRRQPYRDAYRDITAQTDKVPTSAKLVGRMAASAPLAAVLPGGAATGGAIIGGADQALDANPDTGIGERAGRGAVGAIAGGLLGKGVEAATTLPRVLRASSSGANIISREAARAKDATAGFAKALAEGQGNTDTPAINHWLQQPDIAAIHQDLLQNRQFAGMDPKAPEVLDGIYKVLSDHQQQIKRGLAGATPNRPNLGRFTSEDLGLAKQEGLDAMSGGTTLPGPMKSYRPTVERYAKASGDIDALRTGEDMLRSSLNKGITTGKNLDRTTPEAFSRWVQKPSTSPSNANAAAEGVLGATREDLIKHPSRNLIGGRAIGKAPSLLRATGSKSQTMIDLLTKLGLVGANAATAH